ncbi:hypothetical protein CH275_16540 [Rhodococcus sp. 06-235-1A]|uniref:maleylpyruvate isomerase family mycothiol-dependent enzyme n=1 Tax=Rhodococcus sp. 06-235-1A TaxID=2022508 RepID=UPI000B9A4007|nr:maleylpyruvate isomerase family mycothiol-dependent enzyme [Rhodococcus sp. 06-235-1A]OZD03386.1 hypothetical protein CH275_16540 [Rhodococcus sp. 06-235-1A]
MYEIEIQRQGLAKLGSGIDALDQERQRLADWLISADDERWSAPTRCELWDVHDVVAHLASGELYNQACLRNAIGELGAWVDDEEYNTVHVMRRRHLNHEEIHREWLTRSDEVHRLWRSMPQDAALATSYGDYLVGMQCWHIASEYATHNDDMGVPVPTEQQLARMKWRLNFSRFAVIERGIDVRLTPADHGYTRVLSERGEDMSLSAEDFVAAVSARLPVAGMSPNQEYLVRLLRALL